MVPVMDIIGRHLLPEFWHRRPESESALRGVSALIAAAEWQGDGDIANHLGTAAAYAGEGWVTITDPDGCFRLVMRIDYPRQLVQILSVVEA